MKTPILAAVAAATATATAGLDVSGYGSFDVSSAYVLYGAKINKDPSYWTYGELNATAEGWGGPGASLWQNSDMTCRRKGSMRRMNEWDWAAYYRNKFNFSDGCSIVCEAGHIWYKYHGLKNTAKSSYKTMMEAYGRLEFQNPYLTPHVFAAYDWQVTDGTFATLGVKRDIALPFGLTFTPDLTVGGGDVRYLECLYPPWGEENINSGLSYVQISGKLSYWFNNRFGIHSQVACATIANDRIRSGIDADGSDYRKQFVWGMIGVDMAF